MKKALIAIIATIYVIALVIVSFLGTRAEVNHDVVEVQEILLINEDLYRPNAEKIPENRIVHVYKRPDASQIGPNGVGITDKVNWDYEGISRDYAIYIDDYFYLYEMMNAKYTINTSVIPDNATNPKLSYYLQGTKVITDNLEMTDYGEITFKLKHSGWVDVDILIKSTDYSEVQIDVLLKISGYE